MSFKPMIDDFDLELIGAVDTGVEKAIVEYEVPFAEGGILDDMGVKARRFQIRTIWRKWNYELHDDFVTHAAINQVNSFVHPELGVIRGRIKSANVIHDSRRECAEINIEFLEDVSPDVLPAYNPPLEANLEGGFNKVAAALIDAAAADIAANGLDPYAEANSVKPPTTSARGFLARMEKSSAALRGAFNAVLNPAGSAVGVFNFGASLPGALVGTVASAVERAAQIAVAGGGSPTMFVASLRSSVARLCAAAPTLVNNILIAGAAICALFMGKLFAEDESKKTVLRRIEETPRWRPDGAPLSAPPAPAVLSSNELDESLSRVREMIQDGITAAREMGAAPAVPVLAGQADELTRYINAIKLERDRIVSVEVEDYMPLHLICLRHGLPYTYADRICTINSFRNPTFCAGEVRLYERRR